MPTVSIIMATYNQADFIEKSVQSVLDQTFKDYELIVINDGSTDNTGVLFQEKIKSDKIRYCYQENKGAASARNKGLRLATGEYVVFLDSDDLLYPEYLERQMETMRKTGRDMVACDSNLLYLDGTRKNNVLGLKRQDQFYQFVAQNHTPLMAVMAKKEIIITAGLFDESLGNSEDYDLWLRLLANGAVFERTHATLCEYCIHPSGISAKLKEMIYNQTKIINKLNKMIMENPGLLKSEQLKALIDRNLISFHQCLALNIETASKMPDAVRFMEKQYSKRKGIASFLVKCLGYPRYNRLIYFKNSLRYKGYGKKILDQKLAWRRK